MPSTFPTVTTEIAFATAPAAAPTFTNISEYVMQSEGWSAKRQRQNARFQGGRWRLTVDNSDGRFNPDNTAGAYYPNVKAMRRARQTAGYLAEVLADAPLNVWLLSQRLSTLTTGAIDEQRRATGVYTNSPTLSSKDGPFFGTGYVEFALASSTYIDTGDRSIFEAGATTYEAWIKTTAAGANNCIFSEGKTGSSNGASSILIDSAGRAVARFQNDAGAATSRSGAVVNDGQWHHIVMTRSGTTVKLYVDGVQSGADLTIAGVYTQDNSRIGTLASSPEYFTGKISHVALYGSALSAARVAAHYAAYTDGLGSGYIFNGYVEDYLPTHAYPAWSEVEIPIIDGFPVAAAAPASGSPYETEVRADAPVAWWRLSEQDADGPMIDSVGTYDGHFHGEPTSGGPELVAGQSTPSTYFAADTKQRGRYVSTSGAPLTGYPWTFEAVVQMDPGVDGTYPNRWLLWVSDLSNNLYGIEIFVLGSTSTALSGKLAAFCNSAGQARAVHSTKTVSDGRPHHVAVVATSGASILVYVDGVECTSVDTVGTPVFPTAPLEYDVGNRRNTYGVTTGGLGGYLAECALYSSALSGARILEHYNAFATAWKSDYSGTRIARLLSLMSWSASGRQISPGVATLQSASLSGSVLDEAQRVAETENGAVFCTPDLVLHFEDRHTRLYAPFNTSQATFSDQAAGVSYDDIEPNFGVDELANYIRASRNGGVTQIAQDATSITDFFRRYFERSGLLLEKDSEARDYANWYKVNHKSQALRFDQITITPYGAETTYFPKMLGLGLSDRITAVMQPPGVAASTSLDVHIDGVYHAIGLGDARSWVTKYQLTPVDDTDYFTLGVSTLNGTHVLGY